MPSMHTPKIGPDGWIAEEDLKTMFKKVGRDVKISPHAVFYGSENIEIGDNVRIDHGNLFLCSNGWMKIGSHVHLAVNSVFSSGGGIEIEDHVQIGFGAKIFSSSDDVSGGFLVGPTADRKYRKVASDKIILRRLSIVLGGSFVLPGTILDVGALLAPLSQTLYGDRLNSWTIYAGCPCKRLKVRETHCEFMAEKFEKEYAEQKETV